MSANRQSLWRLVHVLITSRRASLSYMRSRQVVQHFTELGLGVTKARISSDGGWFVDVFEIQEAVGGPVTSEAKLSSIKRVSALSRVNAAATLRQDAYHHADDRLRSASADDGHQLWSGA